MSQFDRQLFGFRFVETNRGDSLQIIAARELGDASRWVELVALNNLLPPFITDDPSSVADGVVLSGTQIMAPAPAAATTTTDPEEVFGVDVQLGRGGELMTDGKDFITVVGVSNLNQALRNRINTDRKELIYHPAYGCDVRRLVGVVNGPTAALLGAQAVKDAVAQDPRVNRVKGATSSVLGDGINITVEAEAVNGRAVQAQIAL